MPMQQPAGAGVAADDKEATPNDKSGADAVALDSAPLLCSNITYNIYGNNMFSVTTDQGKLPLPLFGGNFKDKFSWFY